MLLIDINYRYRKISYSVSIEVHAHQGNLRNAIDFIADEETLVLAAADGIVTFVKDDSNTGGI
jgi:murein DD-endopeptidase MepM/ murein hydrolase activator NlpD